MDKELIERIRSLTPRFNPSVANGLAVEHMMSLDPETGTNNTMAYIDRLIKVNQELFPEGLVYVGSRVCPPERHFEEITREYNSRRQANIARSSTYLVEYQFEFKGEKLFPRYVLLPYVTDGGLIWLNGALYNIAPVLADVGFSSQQGSLFIPFRRAKLTFNTLDYHFTANGRREIVHVVWSTIHNEINKRVASDFNGHERINTTLAHYFFCRYGFTQTFKMWANVDVKIGWRNEFSAKEYPRSEYVIYESLKLRKRHPTGDIVIVVPKNQVNELVKMLIAGYFYVADTYPDAFSHTTYVDDINHWRLLLGYIIYGDYEHAGKVLENVDTHLHNFENYLDEITREDLKERSVFVKNIWELLYAILTELFPLFYQATSDDASMYGKRLMVLRYVMDEFNEAISRFAFTFQARRDKVWTADDINDALKLFKPNTCIKRLAVNHGELDTVSYPGMNKVFRLTSMLVPQDSARTAQTYRKTLLNDPTRVLHASIAEVGQMTNQPKNNPDGRGRLNLYVETEVDGSIRRKAKFRELIDKTQKRLSR